MRQHRWRDLWLTLIADAILLDLTACEVAKMRTIFFLLVTCLFPVMVQAQSTKSLKSLTEVRKIYVGSMGQTDEAARFRILLQGELTKEGFAVVENQADADATLSGVLTVRVYSDESLARATLSLDSNGANLWTADFEPHAHFGRTSDTVKLRAEDVAKKLRKDCKLSKK